MDGKQQQLQRCRRMTKPQSLPGSGHSKVLGLLPSSSPSSLCSVALKTWRKGGIERWLPFNIKRDALDLAEVTARGQFSDNLARTAWKGVLRPRRFVSAVEFKMSDADTSEIWKGYMAAVRSGTRTSW